MPNANDRLARFEKAVFSEVEREACEILSEVDVYKEQKLSGVQDQELQQSYQKIQRKLDEMPKHRFRPLRRRRIMTLICRRRWTRTAEFFPEMRRSLPVRRTWRG